MKQPYSPEWLALSRHIGESLISPQGDITLSSGAIDGHLLTWQDQGSGTVLLTRADAWLDWVSAYAPATSPDDYTPAVLAALSDLTFQPVAPLLSPSQFTATLTERTPQSAQSGLMLCLKREGLELRMLLQKANWSALQRAVSGWQSCDPGMHPVASLSLSLVIGRSLVTAAMCQELVSGQGLVLEKTPDLDASQLWLNLGSHHALATLCSDGHVQLTTEFIKDPAPVAQPATGKHPVKDIPLILTAEIGQISLTLGELQQLKPGDVLQQIAALDERIHLKINGYTVAWGQLMQAENGWLVRICQRSDQTAPEPLEELAWTR